MHKEPNTRNPQKKIGEWLPVQKPAEDITWESNSNASQESRSINLLSRSASHVDRVFLKTVLALLFSTDRPTRSSALACLSAYKR